MMSKPSNFLKLLDDFISNYLPCSVGLSPNTITSYKYAFRLLIEFMFTKKGIPADKIIFAHLDYNTLLEFFNWIEKDRGCSIATKNQRLSAILSFSAYAQNRDLSAASIFRTSILKIPMKKGHGKPRAVFTTQEIGILLRLPDDHSEIGIRNKVLLSLMYASGARAQEICNLTVADIEFLSEGARLKLKGKGGKARRIGISDNCGKILQKYITHRQIANKSDLHVFSSQTHEKMTISCIEGIFTKYVTQAKNENPVLFKESSYPPHSMRHATGSHMLEAGVPIVVIKNFLGHKSIQSTQIYAELAQNTIEKHLKEWNEKWFSHNSGELKVTEPDNKKIPDFLSIK